MSNTRKQLEQWLKSIDVKGTVLDVGGASIPVKGRTKTWDVSDYKTLDIRTLPNVDYVEDINYRICAGYKFDTIFCLEVMEYVWNPVEALKNIDHLLKDNGLLYISFHFLFPHHDPSDKDYLRYTKNGIKKLLDNCGFEMMELIPRITIVPDALSEFCKIESKIYKSQSEIGYLVRARKR